MTMGVHKESISHYRRCNVSLSPLLKARNPNNPSLALTRYNSHSTSRPVGCSHLAQLNALDPYVLLVDGERHKEHAEPLVDNPLRILRARHPPRDVFTRLAAIRLLRAAVLGRRAAGDDEGAIEDVAVGRERDDERVVGFSMSLGKIENTTLTPRRPCVS